MIRIQAMVGKWKFVEACVVDGGLVIAMVLVIVCDVSFVFDYCVHGFLLLFFLHLRPSPKNGGGNEGKNAGGPDTRHTPVTITIPMDDSETRSTLSRNLVYCESIHPETLVVAEGHARKNKTTFLREVFSR
jgi:hypothetical protein